MITKNIQDISFSDLQLLLNSAIAPRPIAFISTVDQYGNANLSPFSYFNISSLDPPILIVSIFPKNASELKDTMTNILENAEAVIAVVNEPMTMQMSLASARYDKDVDEFEKAGFQKKNADTIRPYLVAESPVNFECVITEIKPIGSESMCAKLIFCEIKKIHIREEYLDDFGRLNQETLGLTARLGGDVYLTSQSDNLFIIPRPTSGNSVLGFDQLPKEIKLSEVLTGNDLGKLANVKPFVHASFHSDNETHLKAKELLIKNLVAEAWELLKIK